MVAVFRVCLILTHILEISKGLRCKKFLYFAFIFHIRSYLHFDFANNF